MTQQPQIVGSPYQEYIQEQVRNELKAREKKQITSVWFNPAKERIKDHMTGKMLEPESLYIGETAGMAPTWEERVFDVAAFKTAKRLVSEGRSSDVIFNAYVGNYWQNKAAEFADEIEYRTAGVITSEDFSALTVLNVAAELLGETYIPNALEAAVTKVNTPGLVLQIDTYTKFTASQDVHEGATVPTKKGGFARSEITLLKDVGHIALTDEAQSRPYPRDIYQTHVRNAVEDLKRIKATKIATVLESATDIPGGADWAAFDSGTDHSTKNPLDAIGEAADLIAANGGFPNVITSADRPYRDFISNSHIKGQMNPVPSTAYGARVIGGVHGFTWVIDNALTPTMVTVLDKSAVVLAQGPTRTSTYRDEIPGIDGYIIRDWNTCALIQSGFIRNITGISAP